MSVYSPLRKSKVLRQTDTSLERGRIVLQKVENTLKNVTIQLDAVHQTQNSIDQFLQGRFIETKSQENTPPSINENIDISHSTQVPPVQIQKNQLNHYNMLTQSFIEKVRPEGSVPYQRKNKFFNLIQKNTQLKNNIIQKESKQNQENIFSIKEDIFVLPKTIKKQIELPKNEFSTKNKQNMKQLQSYYEHKQIQKKFYDKMDDLKIIRTDWDKKQARTGSYDVYSENFKKQNRLLTAELKKQRIVERQALFSADQNSQNMREFSNIQQFNKLYNKNIPEFKKNRSSTQQKYSWMFMSSNQDIKNMLRNHIDLELFK